MNHRNEKGKEKLPYEKPEIKVIELAAEEVLGIGCKIDGAAPTLPLGLTCYDTQCNVQGS